MLGSSRPEMICQCPPSDTLRAWPGERYPRTDGREGTEMDARGIRAAGRGRDSRAGGSRRAVRRSTVLTRQPSGSCSRRSLKSSDLAGTCARTCRYRSTRSRYQSPTLRRARRSARLPRRASDAPGPRGGGRAVAAGIRSRPQGQPLRLEVYRGPVPDGAALFGWRYGSAQALGPDERVSPLALPGVSVTVADLLP